MSTTLNRNAQKALYLQLAEKLMDDIASKRLLPLEKLPSEYELTQLFDVSRVTVRQALRLLADRGLVVSRQGKGVFVSGPQVSQDLNALRGFYDSLIAQGHTPETEVIDFTLSGAANPNRETLFRGYSGGGGVYACLSRQRCGCRSRGSSCFVLWQNNIQADDRDVSRLYAAA